ncbi:MAG: tRNA (guanosine(37)-N1)-methyltransferase TrmD [Acidobacteriota bacterium]
MPGRKERSPRGNPPPSGDRIAIGVVRRAHGVRGEASVEIWTDSAARFEGLSSVTLVSPDESQSKILTIEGARPHGDRVLVRFHEIVSPEEVSSVRDWTIEIPVDQARALDEDEYFIHDLVGLHVVEKGRRIGTIEDMAAGGGGLIFQVRRPDGGAFELPFAAGICTGVDLEAGEIEVELPEGLERLEALPAVEDQPAPAPVTLDEADEAGVLEHRPAEPSLRVDLITIFPAMFDSLLSEGIVARAVRSGILAVTVWDLRDFTDDRHRSTDDEAYGGGGGMVMLAEPVFRCLDAIRALNPGGKPHVLMTSPQGVPFGQAAARRLAGTGWLVILCGRYEGFDERIRQAVVDEEVSVGDFVVSGGEIPAMLIVDGAARMIEGVVGARNSVEADSFYNGLLDYPHYTRPRELRGLAVPEVLLSGHAGKIRKWRLEQSLRSTKSKRPDLLKSARLDDEALEILRTIETDGSDSGS